MPASASTAAPSAPGADAPPAAVRRPPLARWADLVRWNRPAGWMLLLWPTLSALWIAADGWPGWHLLAFFVLGTILMRSSGCCINDVADRDFDRHVKRTAQRPVTSGEVSVREALLLGAALALLAFALVLTTNPPTILMSFIGAVVTVLYPFAKRLVSMPQAVLGIAFSFGIPMAFSATLGGQEWSLASIPPLAWMLLASNLFWVLAYDTVYAMVDRDDDLRIGMKTSAITLGRHDVVGVTLFHAIHLATWAWIGRRLGMGQVFLGSVVIAALLVVWLWMQYRDRSRDGCFRAFRANHYVGLILFAGTALDLALRG